MPDEAPENKAFNFYNEKEKKLEKVRLIDILAEKALSPEEKKLAENKSEAKT